MDDLIDGVFDVVVASEVYEVTHRGGSLYQLGLNTRYALDRALDNNGASVADKKSFWRLSFSDPVLLSSPARWCCCI